MKVRLTESQYNKLLKVVNPNKKLIITETQYKRLILEANSQVVFSKIKGGQAFKVKASNKDFEFEVIASDNGQLLVKNTNDGRYVNVYFFIDFNGVDNNQLITKISKAKAGPYSRITPELIKDVETWKAFTFKNVTNFQVFKDKTFTDNVINIDTKTGEEIVNADDEEGPMDIDLGRELRDNMIKGVQPNQSYEVIFYDKSTLKLFVLDKKGSVIDIKFKTKSGKESMSYSDVSDKKDKDKELWFKEQDKLINQLTNELSGISDRNKKAEKEKELQKAIELKDSYSSNWGRYEGLGTISTSDYTDGVASKWVENIEQSPEYKNGKGLKIDLNSIKIHESKIKIFNKEEQEEIWDLQDEYKNATDDTEKQRIEAKFNEIKRKSTLHFQNEPSKAYVKGFKGFDPSKQNYSTFDLLVTLIYKPERITKQTNQGMEWDENLEKKDYSKNFSLNGIIDLKPIKDSKGPSLTDKREVNKGDKLDLSRQALDYKEIKDFMAGERNTIVSPNTFLRVLGVRRKGMLPLEALQDELGNRLKTKDPRDLFIAGHTIAFEPIYVSADIQNSKEFETFKSLVPDTKLSKALVKRYTIGDNHVALNMKNGNTMYTLFVQTSDETDNQELKNNEYYIELKYNASKNEAKEPIAKFKIEVKDYNAFKTN